MALPKIPPSVTIFFIIFFEKKFKFKEPTYSYSFDQNIIF